MAWLVGVERKSQYKLWPEAVQTHKSEQHPNKKIQKEIYFPKIKIA